MFHTREIAYYTTPSEEIRLPRKQQRLWNKSSQTGRIRTRVGAGSIGRQHLPLGLLEIVLIEESSNCKGQVRKPGVSFHTREGVVQTDGKQHDLRWFLGIFQLPEIFQFVEIFQFPEIFQLPEQSNCWRANPHRRSRHTANSILHHGFWKYSNARKHSNSRNAATAQKQIHAFVPDTRQIVASTTASGNIPVDGKEQVLGRTVKRREGVAADTRDGFVADKPAQDFLLAVLLEHVLGYSASQKF